MAPPPTTAPPIATRIAAPLGEATLRLQPDSRLVGLVRDGYGRAFEEIVRRYRSRLVAFAAGVVPADRAEDVVQEGLASAYVAISDSDSEIELRPWLYRIVRNRALNSRRDERPHEPLDDNIDGVPQPPDVAQRREDLTALIAGLQALPVAQREAIVRREFEGQGHEQIAAGLETSPGAVRQLIHRARTTLRDGVGFLVPPPLIRALLEAGSSEVGATVGATAAGAATAAGIGSGALVKVGAVTAVGAFAIGSGVAIEAKRDRSTAVKAVAERPASTTDAGRETDVSDGLGSSSNSGPGNVGPAGSCAGEGDGQGDGDSGTSAGSGPSSSGSGSGSGGDGGGNSGPGSGDDSDAPEVDDDSGSGSSGSGTSGSGSSGTGTSGSGTSGSGTSGSGTSGSGSGSSGSTTDSSGSGSSGSGSSGSGSSGASIEIETPEEPEPLEPDDD